MINKEQNAQLLISGFTQREIHIQKRKFYNLFNIDPFLTPLHRKGKWVSLTDDEIKEIVGPWGDTPIKGYTRELIDKINAKLKENNGG
jgi:hypothetical protein